MPKAFTLIEALIALFILSLITSGLFLQEKLSFNTNFDSYLLTVANLQLQNFYERFLVGAGEKDFASWNQQNTILLPDGNGTYNVDIDVVEIKLCWMSKLFGKRCLTCQY